MRVVCIDIGKNFESVEMPELIKGNIYNVLEEREVIDFVSRISKVKAVDGIYYNLIETGYWYHSSLFVKINDIEIDEMELVNNNKEVEA